MTLSQVETWHPVLFRATKTIHLLEEIELRAAA
jgi:hypothetical protein